MPPEVYAGHKEFHARRYVVGQNKFSAVWQFVPFLFEKGGEAI